MDTSSPDAWPSPFPREEEKPLALPPPVPQGHRGQRPAGATSSNQTLKTTLPRKRGRPPKSGQEPPVAQGVTAPVVSDGGSDLLLIDDQGVPYTVSEGSVASGPESSSPKKAPHFCLVCLRAFPYLSDLERHSISHSELKPHECKDCGKTFKRSSHLRRHCNIHAGLRPFRCPLCPRRFREAGELAHHHRVHSGERPYQCPICRLRFMEVNTLRRHIKRKHPEAMEVPLCLPDPEPEPLWDDDGIPATAEAEEEGLEGKELACPRPPATAPQAGIRAGSRAGAGPEQGGPDTLTSSGLPIVGGGWGCGPQLLDPAAFCHPPPD
ncbi:zinc finger protein 524 isoform X2 [Phacochoerus africanus]|nr:zinc finger protein 524 isoform X2 [Phacochoerus africanus]XP_047646653.1 zinc finger protein 524 isoform X2 [Phacochoerus africanus]XP_047646654.1 zinc finger protein 524 isoform X2 [Phacochoerus africanus]XP_047646655.1 zinc finger protein 524 isoform X2 [Phacochoerus africanus]XP_047646656.1 zinc finger protein 524 isoform X2 [Phacochoerus africanus]XP_047646657.1 zinc finger protein 524 isoform X2 [Phacochoerus africanus]